MAIGVKLSVQYFGINVAIHFDNNASCNNVRGHAAFSSD